MQWDATQQNVHPLLVSTQPAHRGDATARRQHTTLAAGRATHSAHLYQLLRHAYTGPGCHDICTTPCRDTSTPELVSTQPAPRSIASDRRQHTTLAVGRPTTNAHLWHQLLQHAYRGSGRHDMRTKPCQDASTPQLVSTQPAPRGIATDGRQHTTLAVGRPTTNAHLYQLLQHAYRGSGRHDTSTCTKPCQDASTPQPVSTQPAPSGDAS